MRRGEVWWAALPPPAGRRPLFLLSRDRAIQVREFVTVAEITRTIRNIPVEVALGPEDGLPRKCVVNLDVIQTIPKRLLTDRITVLSASKVQAVESALKFALNLS
ncbi:MAG: type II toxin-antitoxin system PemK/MazF family toxin [Planctomycetes bacterium]|nr:type II toxin-antitoxin system PemK/MazF family toxin [Planctomycetota bacterium]